MHFPVPTTNSTEQHTSKSIQTEAISKSHQSHSPLLGERLVGLHNPLDRREPLDSQYCKRHSTTNRKHQSQKSERGRIGERERSRSGDGGGALTVVVGGRDVARQDENLEEESGGE